jgi:lipid-A-disaccharide synthase
MESGREAARAALGIAPGARVVALLPGSRAGEVARLAPDFAATAALLAREEPGLKFLAPMAAPGLGRIFAAACASAGDPPVRILDGQARQALQAADAALVASGTASLEALLCRCPMVVAYRLGGITAFLLRVLRLVRLPYFSLPNLLAGEALVPEFFQEAVRPAALASSLRAQLDDGPRRAMLVQRFAAIHASLRCGGAERAAAAVLEVAGRP